jgi:hypothetical protein
VNAIAAAGSDAGIDTAVSAYDADKLEALLLETIGMADMAGELMLREGDTGEHFVALAAGDGGTPTPFVSLPWTDAVEEFRRRGRVTDEDLATLLADIAFRSEEERKRMLEFVQQTAHEKLADVIANDGTYADFAEGLRDETIPLGINPEDDSYLRTVFRTDVASAYSSGRDRASKDPELLAERPFALYLTAGDGLVRSEHAEYAEQNNGVYIIGSAEWEAVRPPPKRTPFNCRCSWVTLTVAQAFERAPDLVRGWVAQQGLTMEQAQERWGIAA